MDGTSTPAASPSSEDVRGALGALAGHGQSALWSKDGKALLELPEIRGRVEAASHGDAGAAVRDVLEAAIARVPTRQYRDLLGIVLGLDPATEGMKAQERRRMAGERFRGGERPVRPGTIRQYHEPRALDQLTEALQVPGAGPGEIGSAVVEPQPFTRHAPDFGDPDAARADPASVLGSFVPIEFPGTGRGLTVGRANDMSVRVIVGRKGSGKTLYLRRLQLALRNEQSVYADDVSTRVPSTDQVVRVSRLCPPHEVPTGLWSRLWQVAILRSALSHITQAPLLYAHLDPGDKDALRNAYEGLGGSATIPRSIGTELSDILFQHDGKRALDNLLASVAVDDAEYELGRCINNLPPLCFFVDGLDDEYRHSPSEWLHCQEGLFHQTMRLLRDGRLGSRLHVTVAIRDVVLASLAQSEHATRFLGSSYVANLRWTSELAGKFLIEKVRRLGPNALSRESASPSLGDWLGRETIVDAAGDDAPLVDYLIAHTRAVPRDVVMLGNGLSYEVIRARQSGEQLSDETIRRAVVQLAATFGREQIAIAASQITSRAGRDLAGDAFDAEIYTDTFGGESPYVKSVSTRLLAILAPYGTGEPLTEADLSNLSRDYREQLDRDDAVELLWGNDLLGVETDEGKVVYRYEVPGADLQMPAAALAYHLHPILRSVFE